MSEQIIEQDWKVVEEYFEKKFGKVPDLQAMLYLIGINEYGHLPFVKFSKQQKQDLIHVAVCRLLEPFDYFMWERDDKDGWPHFLTLKRMDLHTLEDQEKLLQKAIIKYINKIKS